jgi:hypothetical protein
LVNRYDLVIRLDLFFIAFQLAVTGDTVLFEVGYQCDNGASSFLALREFRDTLNHRVRTLARELGRESQIPGGFPYLTGPYGLLLVG